jgi:hypothetical protein
MYPLKVNRSHPKRKKERREKNKNIHKKMRKSTPKTEREKFIKGVRQPFPYLIFTKTIDDTT